MIDVRNMARWPPAQQRQIQAEVERMIKQGYPLRHLMLGGDGIVIYDDLSHIEAIMAGLEPDCDQHCSLPQAKVLVFAGAS